MSDTNAEVEKTTSLEATSVICSICLDEVAGDVNKSTAKLQCGHEFHLDCIVSAFNAKGAKQCPNCRKVETGRWLHASGPPCSVPWTIREDWSLLAEQYGPPYPEIPVTIHYCPFSGVTRSYPSFEVPESSRPAYHNLPRPVSSVPQSYAFFRPILTTSSATNGTIENPNFSYQLNGIVNPNPFPVPNMQYPNGVHNSQLLQTNSAHPSSTDQVPVAPVTLRSMRDIGSIIRSGSYMQPSLLGLGSQSHGRLQPSQTVHPQNNPLGMPAGVARFNGRSTLPLPPVPANSVSNRNGGFFMFPSQGSTVQSSHQTESSFPSGAGADSNRTGNFWNGRWS